MGSQARGFGHSRRRIVAELALVVATLAALVAGGLAALRWLADRAVTRLPVAIDRAVGREAAESLLARETACARRAALDAIVGRFRPHLPEAFRGVQAHYLAGGEVNAFALPGGDLFVLRGLVEAARSSDEVAGVLGHEVGHAVLRHGMRRIARRAGLGVALSLLLGGAQDLVSTLATGAARLGALAYDRDDERAADEFGLLLCARAAIDPRALGEFLGRMPDSPVAWLSTHPSSEERRARLLAAVGGLEVRRGAAPLPGIERLRGDCAE